MASSNNLDALFADGELPFDHPGRRFDDTPEGFDHDHRMDQEPEPDYTPDEDGDVVHYGPGDRPLCGSESMTTKDWKREYDQRWDSKKSLTDNLIERENHAHFNAQLWMTNCFGLNLETLQAIGAGGDIESLILEIWDYQGPAALLRDTADWLAGRREWRKSFGPVLDAAGWRA